MVCGQVATEKSTPNATLLEPALFRKFVANPLLTQSCGEGVAFGVAENEEDSK